MCQGSERAIVRIHRGALPLAAGFGVDGSAGSKGWLCRSSSAVLTSSDGPVNRQRHRDRSAHRPARQRRTLRSHLYAERAGRIGEMIDWNNLQSGGTRMELTVKGSAVFLSKNACPLTSVFLIISVCSSLRLRFREPLPDG